MMHAQVRSLGNGAVSRGSHAPEGVPSGGRDGREEAARRGSDLARDRRAAVTAPAPYVFSRRGGAAAASMVRDPVKNLL